MNGEPRTVILGDLSGLQEFLFAVASGTGGQAKRLRARSFYLQMAAKVASQKMLHAAGWGQEEWRFCAACKFLLEGPALESPAQERVATTGREMAVWLWQFTAGLLTFDWAVASGTGGTSQLWREAAAALHRRKQSPAATVILSRGSWNADQLVLRRVELSALNTPLVPRDPATAERDERDEEEFFEEERIGGDLPRRTWARVFLDGDHPEGFNIFGADVNLPHGANQPQARNGALLYSLNGTAGPGILPRRLSRYVPVHESGDKEGEPVDFHELAARSTGDKKLGVLCMDVDGLGLAFHRHLQTPDAAEAVQLSTDLDHFFSAVLDEERKKRPRFANIYTLFSGGDDLIAAGPWDAVLNYAAFVHAEFSARFAPASLTISAGFVMLRPKFPIARAVELAQAKLARAKTKGGDRMAAFGDVWGWAEDGEIQSAAADWREWVLPSANEPHGGPRLKPVPRGSLQRFITFGESLRSLFGDPEAPPPPADPELIPAHLAYHIQRNIPFHYKLPNGGPVHDWCSRLLHDLTPQNPHARYLAVIARWAASLTRTSESHDRR